LIVTGTHQVLKEFTENGFPGTYIRIREEGQVSAEDKLTLMEHSDG